VLGEKRGREERPIPEHGAALGVQSEAVSLPNRVFQAFKTGRERQ